MKATVANATAFLLLVLTSLPVNVHGAEVAELLSQQVEAAGERVAPRLDEEFPQGHGQDQLPASVPAAKIGPIRLRRQGEEIPASPPPYSSGQYRRHGVPPAGQISEMEKDFQAWQRNEVRSYRDFRYGKAAGENQPRSSASDNFEGGTMLLSSHPAWK